MKDFVTLLKIQGLENNQLKLLKEIDTQKDRVDKIKKNRAHREDEQKELEVTQKNLKEELQRQENNLEDLQAHWERIQENQNLATNEREMQSFQKEIESLAPEIEDSEKKVLEIMETLDESDKLLMEAKTFLEGSLETLESIGKEVDLEVDQLREKISKLNVEVVGLLGQVSPEYKELFIQTNKKHKYNNPLSFAERGKCHSCQYAIPPVLFEQIERGLVIETCPSCERILTPLGARGITD
jgi:predicted  nucleic acid-binding Zn-ribbon protein